MTQFILQCATVVEEKLHSGDSGEVMEDIQNELMVWYVKARDYFKLSKHSKSNYNDCVAKIAELKVAQVLTNSNPNLPNPHPTFL